MIRNRSDIPDRPLSFSDLAVWYGTGRSERRLSATKRYEYKFIQGVVTNIGEIEVHLWRELARETIANANEQAIFDYLVDWIDKTCAAARIKRAQRKKSKKEERVIK